MLLIFELLLLDSLASLTLATTKIQGLPMPLQELPLCLYQVLIHLIRDRHKYAIWCHLIECKCHIHHSRLLNAIGKLFP